MSIVIEKNLAMDLTIFKAIGDVPFSEQINTLQLFYEKAPTKNVIWDLVKNDKVTLSADELQKIIQYCKKNSSSRQGGRTAFVVNTKEKYGLSRMASTFAEMDNIPWPMSVFEDMDTAMAWVSEINNTDQSQAQTQKCSDAQRG